MPWGRYTVPAAFEWIEGAAWSGFMYHGTDEDGLKSIFEDGISTPEFFTTGRKSEALGWAKNKGIDEGQVVSVAVRFDNPLVPTNEPWAMHVYSHAGGKSLADRARTAGYDGVIAVVAPRDYLQPDETWAIALNPETSVRVLPRAKPSKLNPKPQENN